MFYPKSASFSFVLFTNTNRCLQDWSQNVVQKPRLLVPLLKISSARVPAYEREALGLSCLAWLLAPSGRDLIPRTDDLGNLNPLLDVFRLGVDILHCFDLDEAEARTPLVYLPGT